MSRFPRCAGARALVSLISLAAAAPLAHAQSFNIDINTASGPGAGLPSASFGGAAGQPGVWNGISSTSPEVKPLVGLNGGASPVTFTRDLTGSFVAPGNPFTSGSFEKLIDDVQVSDGLLFYSFDHLEAGTYAVLVYAVRPEDSSDTNVWVTGTDSVNPQPTGGPIQGNVFQPTLTHSFQLIAVPADGDIQIVLNAAWNAQTTVAGFQIRKLDVVPLRLHVAADAATGHGGFSWADALASLDDALTIATLVEQDDCEVWVKSGTYKPAGNDRSASFVLADQKKLYGSFAGFETALSQRVMPAVGAPPLAAGSSVLSGEIGAASLSDNCYHVVDADGCGDDTIIDGFTITRGNANGPGPYDKAGGGMSMQFAAATVRNVTFINNHAIRGGAVGTDHGLPRLARCLFRNNASQQGGAIFAEEIATVLTISHCIFLANEAPIGRACYLYESPTDVSNCLFSGNTSPGTAGAACESYGDNGDISYTNCTFSGNISDGGTGGIFANWGSNIELSNCVLWGNTAVGGTAYTQQVKAYEPGGSSLTVHSSTIQGAAFAAGLNPLFVDADGADNLVGTLDDDCRLAIASPCIDFGDNAWINVDTCDVDGDGDDDESVPLDLDAQPRRIDVPDAANSGGGMAPHVDRGCYENQLGAACVDLNGDEFVNGVDLSLLLGNWGRNEGLGDLDGDGTVGAADLAMLLGGWGPCDGGPW